MATFKLVWLKEARKFLSSVPRQAYRKILNNVWRVAGGEKNSEFFKKLENTQIWEFRTFYDGVAYRLFAFWDKEKETYVILTHGIIKKSQKTPRKEIAKAERLRKEYLEDRKKGL